MVQGIIYELEREVYKESRPDSNAGKTHLKLRPIYRSKKAETKNHDQDPGGSSSVKITDPSSTSNSTGTSTINKEEPGKIKT